jgi:hypothetical protein
MYPWDRLCDALNGSGVYSLDEALQELRLQPLVDALHGVISEGNIRMLAKAAGESLSLESLSLEQAKDVPPVDVQDAKGKGKGAKKVSVEPEVPVATNGAKAYVAPDLSGIVDGTGWFVETALRLSAEPLKDGEKTSNEAESPLESRVPGAGPGAPKLEAVVRLPAAVLTFPEELQKAAHSVLPSQDVHVPAAQVWAPVLGWIAVRALPSPAAALALFDELRLRHALAETCSAVGVKGEDAWRVAAGIRVLLRVAQEPTLREAIETEGFWQDADVRWLTGTHADEHGVEYFEKDRLESFACWLQLPGLLAGAEDVPGVTRAASHATTAATAIAADLAYAAKVAGYKVKEFLEEMFGEAAEARVGKDAPEEKLVKKAAIKKKAATKKSETGVGGQS